MAYLFPNDPPFVPSIPAEQTYEAELRRRQFMQVYNRYLGWGLRSATDHTPGVHFTSEGWMRPYQKFECFVSHAECGGDREETERRVIDMAIAAYDNAAIEVKRQEAEDDARRAARF